MTNQRLDPVTRTTNVIISSIADLVDSDTETVHYRGQYSSRRMQLAVDGRINRTPERTVNIIVRSLGERGIKVFDAHLTITQNVGDKVSTYVLRITKESDS